MNETQARGASGMLAALKVGVRVWARTLRVRWAPLLVGTVAYLALIEGSSRLWDLIPESSAVADWPLWALGGLWRYTLFQLLGAFATLQVLAVVDGRAAGPRATAMALGHRLVVAVCLAMLSGLLVFPIQTYLHGLAQTESRMAVAQVAVLLNLAGAVVGMAIGVFTCMVMPLAVDRNLSTIQAFRAGAGLGARRWGSLLLTSLLVSLIPAAVGVLALQASVYLIPYEWIEQNRWFLIWQVRDAPSRFLSLLAVPLWPAIYVALRQAKPA